MKFGFKDDNMLPLILLLFCFCCNDNGLEDLLDDWEDWLPWILVLICCGDGLLEDLLDDIEDWLPWLLLIYCCCFRDKC